MSEVPLYRVASTFGAGHPDGQTRPLRVATLGRARPSRKGEHGGHVGFDPYKHTLLSLGSHAVWDPHTRAHSFAFIF